MTQRTSDGLFMGAVVAIVLGFIVTIMGMLPQPASYPYRDTAVRVAIVVDGNEVGHGSAVHIGNGYFLTAGHVVGAWEEVIEGHAAQTVREDDKLDIAVLYVPELADMPYVVLARDNPQVGDEITITGFPLNLGKLTFFGRVADDVTEAIAGMWVGVLDLNIAAAPGVSGSGVIDAHGRVVGILVAGITMLGGHAIMVPVDTFEKLLDGLDIERA